jgi:hypothetical protein
MEREERELYQITFAIAKAKALVASSEAGISAESGIASIQANSGLVAVPSLCHPGCLKWGENFFNRCWLPSKKPNLI